MTLLKLSKHDKDLLARFCAESMVEVKFYTVETNDNLVLCEIDTDSKAIIFSLGKMVGMATIHGEWLKTTNI